MCSKSPYVPLFNRTTSGFACDFVRRNGLTRVLVRGFRQGETGTLCEITSKQPATLRRAFSRGKRDPGQIIRLHELLRLIAEQVELANGKVELILFTNGAHVDCNGRAFAQ